MVNDLVFEWDEEKNKKNLKKHGVDFDTAMLVFNDTERIDVYDEENSLYEDRFWTIGKVRDIMVIVYTVRSNSIRFISARIANKEEREIYYGKKSFR